MQCFFFRVLFNYDICNFNYKCFVVFSLRINITLDKYIYFQTELRLKNRLFALKMYFLFHILAKHKKSIIPPGPVTNILFQGPGKSMPIPKCTENVTTGGHACLNLKMHSAYRWPCGPSGERQNAHR